MGRFDFLRKRKCLQLAREGAFIIETSAHPLPIQNDNQKIALLDRFPNFIPGEPVSVELILKVCWCVLLTFH